MMGCKCAESYDEDTNRYQCAVSGGECVFLIPDSKRSMARGQMQTFTIKPRQEKGNILTRPSFEESYANGAKRTSWVHVPAWGNSAEPLNAMIGFQPI